MTTEERLAALERRVAELERAQRPQSNWLGMPSQINTQQPNTCATCGMKFEPGVAYGYHCPRLGCPVARGA